MWDRRNVGWLFCSAAVEKNIFKHAIFLIDKGFSAIIF